MQVYSAVLSEPLADNFIKWLWSATIVRILWSLPSNLSSKFFPSNIDLPSNFPNVFLAMPVLVSSFCRLVWNNSKPLLSQITELTTLWWQSSRPFLALPVNLCESVAKTILFFLIRVALRVVQSVQCLDVRAGFLIAFVVFDFAVMLHLIHDASEESLQLSSLTLFISLCNRN